MTFMGDTLVIDSLFMEDNSALLFHKDAFVVIKNSFIGHNTLISSAGNHGRDGRNVTFYFGHASNGKNGLPGKDLTLFINFNELESLIITSQGGNGGNGGHGYYEGKSGNGGSGGSGGNLSVYYTYDQHIPRFNRLTPGPHSVQIRANAGICGSSGRALSRNRKKSWYKATNNRYLNGREQPQTYECYSGEDGEIVLKKVVYE